VRTEFLELRPGTDRPVATGSLACPECDAPVAPAPGAHPLGEPMSCGWCGRHGTIRDFLSLAQPTRPARVVIRARVSPPRAA
jgi:hypothetical protein